HPAVISDHSVVDSRNYYLDAAADSAMKLATVGGEAPSSDLVVHTTMEPEIQEAARVAAVRNIHKSGKKERASEAAVVVMKPDGAIAALIGGVDYDESVYNRATQAHRQPGSAFKPFVYLAALELTTAYAAFASGGNRVYPYFVNEVDSGGKILYRRNAPPPQRIIASHVNRDLVQMLYGVVTSGTGRSAALDGHEAAGKTGTTQDYHDA